MWQMTGYKIRMQKKGFLMCWCGPIISMEILRERRHYLKNLKNLTGFIEEWNNLIFENE